jgi:hypothetical protein
MKNLLQSLVLTSMLNAVLCAGSIGHASGLVHPGRQGLAGRAIASRVDARVLGAASTAGRLADADRTAQLPDRLWLRAVHRQPRAAATVL